MRRPTARARAVRKFLTGVARQAERLRSGYRRRPEQEVAAVTGRAEVVDVGDGVTARGASRREMTLRFYRAVILVGVVLIVASTF
jgi:hypothetical protein